jgi:hypothetical protein
MRRSAKTLGSFVVGRNLRLSPILSRNFVRPPSRAADRRPFHTSAGFLLTDVGHNAPRSRPPTQTRVAAADLADECAVAGEPARSSSLPYLAMGHTVRVMVAKGRNDHSSRDAPELLPRARTPLFLRQVIPSSETAGIPRFRAGLRDATRHRSPSPPYFFAGAFPASTSLRSNFPLLSAKSTQSEALSQLVVCR